MTSSSKRILERAMALSEDERRGIAEALWDSLPEESEAEIEQAWAKEAERRLRALEEGDGESVDLHEALATLRAELRRSHR